MGDKGQKDKNKHDKQVNKSKNAKNEAKRKKQEKAHQQEKGRGGHTGSTPTVVIGNPLYDLLLQRGMVSSLNAGKGMRK